MLGRAAVDTLVWRCRGTDDDQIHYLALATLVRVVEENLGSIRPQETLGGECRSPFPRPLRRAESAATAPRLA